MHVDVCLNKYGTFLEGIQVAVNPSLPVEAPEKRGWAGDVFFITHSFMLLEFLTMYHYYLSCKNIEIKMTKKMRKQTLILHWQSNGFALGDSYVYS